LVAGLISLLIWMVVRERESRFNQTLEVSSTKIGFLERAKGALGQAQSWYNGIFAGLTFAVIAAFAGLWCVPFLRTVYGLSLITAAEASSMVFVGVAFGCPFLGWLSDRIGKRRIVMFYGTLICLAAVTAAIYLSVPLWMMFVLLFIVGATSSVYILPFAIVRSITPAASRGTAMGFVNMLCITLGAPILQPLIGYMLRSYGSGKTVAGVEIFSTPDFHLALIVLPMCLIVALIMLLFIKDISYTE